jgi:hypothetical protein
MGGPSVDAGGFLTLSSTITFNPAKLPKGEVLAVVEYENNGEIGASSTEGLSNRPTGCEVSK